MGLTWDPPHQRKEHMSTDLAVLEHDHDFTPAPITLFDTTDPDAIVAEASRHAKALAKVIEDRQLFKQIGPSKHILVEGWQTLGAMLRTFAVSEGEPEFVEIDGVTGFKSTVCAMRDGEVIGRATSFCMRDESTWKNRPLHALSGMAQTRATSRALKGPLGFIVKLAGYSATPAEEMTIEDAQVEEAPAFQPPSEKPASDKQAKMLDDLINKATKDGVVDAVELSSRFEKKYGTSLPVEMTSAQASEAIKGMQRLLGEAA